MRQPQAVVRRIALLGALATGAAAWLPSAGAAQDLALAGRTPRFLYAQTVGATPKEIDATRSAVLRRVVSLRVEAPTIGRLLAAIERQTGLTFAYDGDFPLQRPITLRADSITVAAALSAILFDTGVDVLLTPGGNAALVRVKPRSLPARAGSIVGRVTDAKTGLGVVRAEVFLDGTSWRTATDTGGRYRLTEVIPGRYTLTVRQLGYEKQDRQVAVRDSLEDSVNVALEPVVTRLNELVTTATGQQRRMDIANDITTINADSIVRTDPIRSVTDLLETRVPGLTVQRTSGAPGDPARLRLRGVHSPLRSNDPIVIVDGVRVYAEQSAARSGNLAQDSATLSGGRGYATPSPLDYLDPNTIEKIEVIKGPSAATLYGQDAANGVILITTKKGQAGPTRWSFRGEHGTSRVPGEFPNLSLSWGHLSYFTDQPVWCPVLNVTSNGQPCQSDSVLTYQLLNDPALTVLDHGHRNAITLGASGGVQALTYSVTGSYGQETGLFQLPGYEVDRYPTLHGGQAPADWMIHPQQLTQWAVSSNVAARLGKNADVALVTQVSRTAQDRSSLEQQLGALQTTYLNRSTGIYYRRDSGGDIQPVSGDVLTNYFQQVTSAASSFTGGLSASWRPRSWLTLDSRAGLNLISRSDAVYLPQGAVVDSSSSLTLADFQGAFAGGHGNTVVGTAHVGGVAIAPIGLGLNVRFAAGVDYAGTSTNDLNLRTRHLPAGTRTVGDTVVAYGQTIQDAATFGWYVEPSLTHRKFSLSTGLRLDGGSSYGVHASLPPFPKLGFSYMLSDEPFFPFKDLFQSLKLRVAYGRASRQPGIVDRLRIYTVASSRPVDGQQVDVVGLQGLGNTQLRPERSTELEGGVDADLLDSRLSVGVTLYRNTTDDALQQMPLAPSLYGDGVQIWKNIGVVRNTGLEATLTTQVVRSRLLTWAVDVGVRHDRNVVVKLGPGVEPFYTQQSGFGNGFASGQRVAPGYPLFGRWSLPILGYADANGNGVLETSEVLLGDTAVYVGASTPNYEASVHTNLSLWRGVVTVSVGLDYQDGLSQRNETALTFAPFSAARNSPGASLAQQVATMDLGALTDFNWIQTVNTFRFNSLSVMYRLPQEVARRVGAQQLDVAVQGTNLGLWTNYRGLDPNVNAYTTGNSVTDGGVLPQPRTWQVRIAASY